MRLIFEFSEPQNGVVKFSVDRISSGLQIFFLQIELLEKWYIIWDVTRVTHWPLKTWQPPQNRNLYILFWCCTSRW